MSAAISTDDTVARDSPRRDLPTERSRFSWNWYNHPEDVLNRTEGSFTQVNHDSGDSAWPQSSVSGRHRCYYWRVL
jgi:hypothetical protein